MNDILRHLRRATLLREEAGVSDGQLLECFLARRDADAFAAIVRRHGPMVLGVCRRVVGNGHDAEDAFQATFLVLVRKAASVRPRELVGHWLYGVAYRTSLKMRSMTRKRRDRERHARPPEPPAERVWQDLVPLLDRELNRLPDKYRVPVVLCDLEGHSRRDVARRLGWPEGTLSGRLARARALLAKRLRRHVPTLSGGALAAVLDQNAAAGVPVWLLRATFRIATGQAACPVGIAALAKGVLQAMLLERLKIVVAVCCVAGLLSAGVGAVALRSVAAEPETPKKKLTRPQKAEELLPTDPLPTPVVVALDSGEIVVKHRVVMYHAERQPDGSIAWRPTHELHERRHAAEEVRAYNTRGEEVDADDLAHLLRKEALAFAYLNGQKVDLLHLRLLKDGSLVFALPKPPALPAQPAAPGFPGVPGGVPLPPPAAPLPRVPGQILPPRPVPPPPVPAEPPPEELPRRR